MSERYEELSDDVKNRFMEIYESKSFPIKIAFKFVDDSKLKQVIKIQKLPEIYQFLLEKEVIVYFNEALYDKMDSDDLVQILIEQELDKLSINIDSGKIKMNKSDLITSAGLINKYGSGAVMRANQIDIMSNEQSEDMANVAG
jgi:hypothetical protein